MLTQSGWRKIGATTIVCSALMAWFGTRPGAFEESALYLIVYWAIFVVLLLCSLFIAVLDIQYIRMQYAIGKRELFRQTLGSEELRKALRKGTAVRKGAGGNGRASAQEEEKGD